MKLIRYEYPNLPSVNDFDRLFNDVFAGLPRFGGLFDAPAARVPADLYEDDENVYARFELPGFKRDELNVQLENAVLTVSVARKANEKERREQVQFTRSVTVPEGINAEKVKARFEDGVLTVTLPKQEARKPRAIEIR